MTLFSSQSQLVTLSRLDRVLWDADSSITLFLEPSMADRFLDGILVLHLRRHATKNQGIVFTPAGEEGIIYSLAEALGALFEDIDVDQLAAMSLDQWPTVWKNSLSCDGFGPHRLLIIDQFEDILNAPFEEQSKFCALLSHFSAEKRASVLLVTDPANADSFAELSGLQHLEKDGNSIQTAPATYPLPALEQFSIPVETPPPLIPEDSTQPPFRLLTSPALASLGIVATVLTILYLTQTNEGGNYPSQTGEVIGALPAIATSEFEQFESNLIVEKQPLPAPLGIEVAANFDLPRFTDNDARHTESSMQQFMELEVALSGSDYHETIAGTLTEVFAAPVDYRFPNKNTAFSAGNRSGEIIVKPTLIHETTLDTTSSESTAKLTPMPLTVEDLLRKFKLLNDKSISDLRGTLQLLLAEFPERNSESVSNWISQIEANQPEFELSMAGAYAGIKDLEATFSWYQNYAERTSDPEILFHVGAAQMFGRGTSVDYDSATEYLFRAWQAGNSDATYLYGVAQLLGLGVGKNERQAYYTLNTAMESGSTMAYREAGRMQELGIGDSQNLYWASHLYEKGAALGEPYCMKRLAEIHGTGENRLYPIDQVKADFWIEKIENSPGDPILHLVRNLMPENFYTKRVQRYGN